MGSKPPQTRKGTQGFPFQTLPHSAGNGREKGGAGAPERNNKSKFIKENIDEIIFMFALFKCRKSDKGRN